MDCLENIIGITETECECFDSEFNESAKQSNSGLYMDGLSEFPLRLSTIAGGTQYCEQIQTKMMAARDAGIQMFKEELFKQIALRYSMSVQPYIGNVGSSSFTKNIGLNKMMAGIYIVPNRMGATFMLKQIDAYFGTTNTFNLLVYQNNDLIRTIQIQSQADNKVQTVLPVAIPIPFLDEGGDVYKYKFLYNSSGNIPKDNAIRCGCGSEIKLDKYITRSGITCDDLSDFTTSQLSYGLVLSGTFSCGTENIICNEYANPLHKMVIEATIRRKSVEVLIADLLSSNVINRDTMTNREQMVINATKLHNKFKNDVQWLAEQINLTSDGCFSCNSNESTISIGGIRL